MSSVHELLAFLCLLTISEQCKVNQHYRTYSINGSRPAVADPDYQRHSLRYNTASCDRCINPPGCGEFPCTHSMHIVNGKMSYENQFPYMVTLKENGRHFCGASIINSRHALTAAHCVYSRDDGSLKMNAVVVVGDHRMNMDDKHERIYPIERIISKKYPDDPTGSADVAVIRTRDNIQFNAGVKPVCLAMNEPNAGQNLIISGWGSDAQEKAPNELYYTTAVLQTSDRCRQQTTGGGSHIDYYICTIGPSNTGSTPCHGDSGGPLVIQRGSGGSCRTEQVGAVSFGNTNKCTTPGALEFYVSVAKVTDWIESAVNSFW